MIGRPVFLLLLIGIGVQPCAAYTPSGSPSLAFTAPTNFDYARYEVPSAERGRIKANIKKCVETSTAKEDMKILYMDYPMGLFDSFIPNPYGLHENPGAANPHYQWTFSKGRLLQIDSMTPWITQTVERVWYNGAYAPILSASYGIDGAAFSYRWADYDTRGYLRRVCTMSGDFTLQSACWFVNAPAYASTETYRYNGATGKLDDACVLKDDRWMRWNRRTDYEAASPDGGEWHDMGANMRLQRLVEPQAIGLAPLYPIPTSSPAP